MVEANLSEGVPKVTGALAAEGRPSNKVILSNAKNL